MLINFALNCIDNGVSVYENTKTLEEWKRERDRKRYANMSADAKKEKISKANLARTPD